MKPYPTHADKHDHLSTIQKRENHGLMSEWEKERETRHNQESASGPRAKPRNGQQLQAP